MPERPLPPNWLRTDTLTVVALAAFSALMVWISNAAGIRVFEQPVESQMVGSVLITLPLVVRRRFPLTVAVLQAAIYIAATYLTGLELYVSQIVIFLGFYSVGAWSKYRGRALIVRAVIFASMIIWLFASVFGGIGGVSPSMTATEILAVFALNSLINIAFFTGAWIFGDRSWQQWMERESLVRAEADIKALQSELVDAAIETERLRIARELHDVVAHHVTAMSVQAAAARRILGRDPEAAEEALKSVEASGRSAVQDLRSLVLTLRDQDSDGSSLATIDDIDGLVDAARAAGREVSYDRIGDLPELSPAVELTLFRVAQEGLTNVNKHAGPNATVALRLRGLGHAVELEVSDDGYATGSLAPGTGTGIIGMRERVTAVGGTLEAGPKPRGGYMVRASIPTVVTA